MDGTFVRWLAFFLLIFAEQVGSIWLSFHFPRHLNARMITGVQGTLFYLLSLALLIVPEASSRSVFAALIILPFQFGWNMLLTQLDKDTGLFSKIVPRLFFHEEDKQGA